MSEVENLEGYCFKCKEKRPILNPQAEWAANGAPGTRGTCPVCEGTIYKTGHTPAHDNLPKPEITAAPKKKSKKSKTKKSASKSTVKAKSNGTPLRGKLVVVESPAKAKTIGRYLGRGYTVKSSVGHVRDLLKSRLSVDIENGYSPDYRVPNDKRKVVKDLKDAASKAKEIFLATDPDREGEAIAWHVLESADMDPERTKRVVFHEITKPAVQAAFDHPREIDMDRVDAQQARRILDRLVGYKLSPLLWRKVRGRLSAGRVQSVAVRLTVEREREIEEFVEEEYWTLGAELSQLQYEGLGERPYFTAKLHKLKGDDPVFNSEAAIMPHVDALETAVWHVGEVRLGKRSRRPQAPFTTSTLQQEASRKLNFGTNKTMRVAQQLYEGVDIGGEDGSVGLITYMRTDSVNVSTEAQREAREYVTEKFGADYVPDKPPVYKTKAKAAQEAHEAIRPTSALRAPKQIKQYLSRDQYRLYLLIWQRFVASQMSPAVYDTVSADIWAGEAKVAVEKRPYLFRATGSTLRFTGFLALYEETEPEDRPEGDEQVPSDLQSDEELDLLRLLPEQHFTQPPPRYSEATLVRALEENGVGRPSTYASIISTIQQRGYVDRGKDKRLHPTEIGRVVNDLLVEYFPDVLSVDFTARLEAALDEIAEGTPWVPVVDSFYGRFAENLEIANEKISKVDLNEPKEVEFVGRDCPECGNPLVYRQGRYGRFIGCSTFPKCRHTEQVLNKLGVKCPNDGGELVEKRTRRGKVFYGCANYPDCDWTSWKRPLAQTCRLCNGLLVQVDKQTAECTKCGERQPIKQREAVTAAD